MEFKVEIDDLIIASHDRGITMTVAGTELTMFIPYENVAAVSEVMHMIARS